MKGVVRHGAQHGAMNTRTDTPTHAAASSPFVRTLIVAVEKTTYI